MPLFAALFNSFAGWLSTAASSVMFYVFTVTWARRLAIVALGAAFFVAVTACVSSLLGMVAELPSGPLSTGFVMGLGMFIPSNAVAIIACLSSVYIACLVYRLKLEALRW